MRFWDSSALVPLLVDEPASRTVLAGYRLDPEVISWWATPIECTSAIARLEREGALDSNDVRDALGRLTVLEASWHEIQPTSRVRELAVRLLRVHPIRAADALQLAAAMVASEGSPSSLSFVSFDDRLLLAAEREGFPTVRPGDWTSPRRQGGG